VVATYERTSTGRHEVVQRRYGAGVSEPGQAVSWTLVISGSGAVSW